MNASITGILVVIVAYLIFMIVIGYYCSKKTNDVGDFFLGGRKLGPIVTAMSAEASDNRSGNRHLPELADRCQKAAPLYCEGRKRDHTAGIFLQPLPR